MRCKNKSVCGSHVSKKGDFALDLNFRGLIAPDLNFRGLIAPQKTSRVGALLWQNFQGAFDI